LTSSFGIDGSLATARSIFLARIGIKRLLGVDYASHTESRTGSIMQQDEKENKINILQGLPNTWVILILFDKPTAMKQLIVEPASSGFPAHEIKWLTNNYVIITTFGVDPPAGILDIYSTH
jgi:hypothetical protein